jgi:hypothetical protein
MEVWCRTPVDQNELSLDRGELVPELGNLMVVAQLHPLLAPDRLGMHGSIATRLQPQLNVLAPGDADELAVERLGAGALLYTAWVGGATGTGIRFEPGLRDFRGFRVCTNHLQLDPQGRCGRKTCPAWGNP